MTEKTSTYSRSANQPERPTYLEFGWNAAPFAQQLPQLTALDAEHFDKDNAAIIRLHMRGFITDGERDRAISRVTRDVRAKLRSLTQAPRHG